MFRYRDLKKVQVGPEKLPNWCIYHSVDVTRDQKCTQNMTPDLEPKRLGTTGIDHRHRVKRKRRTKTFFSQSKINNPKFRFISLRFL